MKSIFTGTLLRLDLGSGAWALQSDAGTRYQLDGDIPAGLAGQRVTVEGQASSAFTFAASGPVISVSSIKAAS